MQGLKALVGRASEASADSIENTERFDLSAVGLLIDDNGRVDIGAIVFPV